MLNGHNTLILVQEGQDLLNADTTSGRTARRFLARYLTNPQGPQVVEVTFDLKTETPLTRKQYLNLKDYAAANYATHARGDDEVDLVHFAFKGVSGSATKGLVTYRYELTTALEGATASTYRDIVYDLVWMVKWAKEFDNDPQAVLENYVYQQVVEKKAQAAQARRREQLTVSYLAKQMATRSA